MLSFDNVVDVIISWAMRGYTEGLDVEVGGTGSFPCPSELQSEHEVSNSQSWRDKLGGILSQVSVAWQKNSKSPESAWALRLGFNDREPVVLALGIIEQGIMRYHPDGLLVLFDERDLRSYNNPSIALASQLCGEQLPIRNF